MKKFEKTIMEFRQLNSVAQYNATVVFGSTFAAELHVSELAQTFQANQPMYNRSVAGLSVADAGKLLQDCVFDLFPSTVFVNLGEVDLDSQPQEEVLGQYEWILYQIHAKLPNCSIEVVSVCSEHPNAAKFNFGLKNMAKQAGCEFVDLAPVLESARPEVRAFGILRSFMHSGPICFGDAMTLAME